MYTDVRLPLYSSRFGSPTAGPRIAFKTIDVRAEDFHVRPNIYEFGYHLKRSAGCPSHLAAGDRENPPWRVVKLVTEPDSFDNRWSRPHRTPPWGCSFQTRLPYLAVTLFDAPQFDPQCEYAPNKECLLLVDVSLTSMASSLNLLDDLTALLLCLD